MIISEKQIMQLIVWTSSLINRMVKENAPISVIENVSSLLVEIANQQSDKLIEVKDE